MYCDPHAKSRADQAILEEASGRRGSDVPQATCVAMMQFAEAPGRQLLSRTLRTYGTSVKTGHQPDLLTVAYAFRLPSWNG